MNSAKLKFLKEIAGPDGAAALLKAVSATPSLSAILLPRAIISWMEAISNTGNYSENIPGTNTRLSLAKTETGYSGIIDFPDNSYSFNNVTLFHVAGGVSVALGDREERIEFTSPSLAKLGKSIDVLVKSRALRKAQAKSKGGAGGSAHAPGPAAAARPPQPPVGPTNVQAKPNMGQMANGAAGTAVSGQEKKVSTKVKAKAPETPAVAAPKAPGSKLPSLVKARKNLLKISKSEAQARCELCGGLEIQQEKFVGCRCFGTLGQASRTEKTETGYNIEFLQGWDRDALLTIAGIFKGQS